MPEPCLLDNDVVLKVAAYRLNGYVLDLLTVTGETPAMIGVGRFVVRQKASRKKRFRSPEVVANSVEDLLEQLQLIEPSEEEIELAADMETSALAAGGALDTGEAQLLAILLTRMSPAFVTGDKRAIEAAAGLEIPAALGRFICLEQVFMHLVFKASVGELRENVCEEPSADRALANCFACASRGINEIDADAVIAALHSYVDHLRQRSGQMLMADENVSALSA